MKYLHIRELRRVLNAVKPSYLLTEGLSDDEKDEIDMKSRIELKKYNERLIFLEEYEKKRCQSKQFYNLFPKSQSNSINKHREGVLLSLNYELKQVSKMLIEMQETRLMRRRDLEIGDYEAKVLKASLNNSNSNNNNFLIEEEEAQQQKNVNNYQELSKDQLQILQSENNEILNEKLQDLAKVEQIFQSVVEISQLETQLSEHLTVQSENINNLVNDNDFIQDDLIEGNKHLRRAKDKGNYSIKIVIITSVLMGVILLFFDFIN